MPPRVFQRCHRVHLGDVCCSLIYAFLSQDRLPFGKDTIHLFSLIM